MIDLLYYLLIGTGFAVALFLSTWNRRVATWKKYVAAGTTVVCWPLVLLMLAVTALFFLPLIMASVLFGEDGEDNRWF